MFLARREKARRGRGGQKDVRNAAAFDPGRMFKGRGEGEREREREMHIQDRNDAISMAHT